MSLSQAQVFFLVALNEGAGGVELHRLSGGIKRSTLSRILLDLSLGKTPDDKAAGLIDRAVSDIELRKNAYSLTPKGHHLLEEIVSILQNR